MAPPALARAWHVLKDSASFRTNPNVVLKDWRLGLTVRVLELGAVLALGYLVLHEQRFLQTTEVTGTSNVYLTETQAFYDEQQHFYQNTVNSAVPFKYCNNATSSDPRLGARYGGYNYWWSDAYTYKDIGCVFPDDNNMWKRTGESFIVFTHGLFTERVNWNDALTEEKCAAKAQLMGSTTNGGSTHKCTVRAGLCRCQRHTSVFYVGVEKLNVVITHMYRSILGNGRSPQTYITTPGCSVETPEKCRQLCVEPAGLYADDPLCTLKFIPDGMDPSVTVDSMLKYAGVDLDTTPPTCASGNGRKCATRGEYVQNQIDSGALPEGLAPMLRLTGVTIELQMRYMNQRFAERFLKVGPERELGATYPKTVCIMTASPDFVWSSAGPESAPKTIDVDGAHRTYERYAFGVKVHFAPSGIKGAFSFARIIAELTQLVVLMGLVSRAVNFIAVEMHIIRSIPGFDALLSCLGGLGRRTRAYLLQSESYANFISTPLVYEREYARFAAQTIAAKAVFDRVDVNKNGRLEAEELHAKLMSVSGDSLPKEEVDRIVEWMFWHGRHSVNEDATYEPYDSLVKRGATFTASDWCSLSTIDNTNFNQLHNVIEDQMESRHRAIAFGHAESTKWADAESTKWADSRSPSPATVPIARSTRSVPPLSPNHAAITVQQLLEVPGGGDPAAARAR